jgi:hypothetical protein
MFIENSVTLFCGNTRKNLCDGVLGPKKTSRSGSGWYFLGGKNNFDKRNMQYACQKVLFVEKILQHLVFNRYYLWKTCFSAHWDSSYKYNILYRNFVRLGCCGTMN